MKASLRSWRIDDAADLHRALIDSGDLTAQFGDTDLSSRLACEQFIAKHWCGQNALARHFALDVEGTAVGGVGNSHIDARHGTGWASYWVSRPTRGAGLASRGLAGAAGWAFSTRVFRLELGHRVNNPASCQVAIAAGFAVEGVERAKLRYGQKRFDVETHARLAIDPEPVITPLPLH